MMRSTVDLVTSARSARGQLRAKFISTIHLFPRRDSSVNGFTRAGDIYPLTDILTDDFGEIWYGLADMGWVTAGVTDGDGNLVVRAFQEVK